MVNTIFWKR